MTIRPQNQPGTNFYAIIYTERMVVFRDEGKNEKGKISQPEIQHGAKHVVYDKARLDFGRKEGYCAQPAFSSYSSCIKPYQSICFTDNTIRGGKTSFGIGVDLDDRCICSCFDVCVCSLGVCEYECNICQD